jgi:2-dehydro-3-deoxyphosphogluconate aldolase/(4S)-4-hydroxy-2-oxoglutarate aldolase
MQMTAAPEPAPARQVRGAPVMEAIGAAGVVAVLRAADAGRFEEVALALTDAGVTCVEFTLSSAGALEALRRFAGRCPPGVVLGAGTVLDPGMADAAVDAGAAFLVAPTVSVEVIALANRRQVPVVPGAFTPTEILTAWRAGADAVKVFPASVGGPAYVRAVKAPLPDVPLVPTGGVALEDAPRYIEAGALAVGIGAPLVGDAGAGGDLAALRGRAERVVAAVRAARSG